MRETTESWLEEIKQEVKDKGLMYFPEEEGDTGSLENFLNKGGRLSSPEGSSAAGSGKKSMAFFSRSKQSSMYVRGMTQSTMELYKVGKEKKRLSHLRHAAEAEPKTRDST